MFQRRRGDLFIDRRCISYNENDPNNRNRFKVLKHLPRDNDDIDHSQITITGGRKNVFRTSSIRSRPTSGGTNTSIFYISRFNNKKASGACE